MRFQITLVAPTGYKKLLKLIDKEIFKRNIR